MSFLAAQYQRWVLSGPWPLLILLLAGLAFFGWHAQSFRLDASADSLLLEDDQDLKIYRELSERYRAKSFLVVAIVPQDELFSRATLHAIDELADELADVNGVESINSILDVPLLQQGEGSLTELAGNFKTLRDAEVDLERAKTELIESPVFSELIVSKDGAISALQLNLTGWPEFEALQQERRALGGLVRSGEASASEVSRLRALEIDYQRLKQEIDQANHQTILSLREVLGRHQSLGRLVLGGVSMIADDMISFIRSDLINFGAGVLAFLVLMLAFIFRSVRWVLLPLASCVYAGLVMMGLLGVAGWQVTVISSNFISLMLILTMSMNVHLIVRYRQFAADHPDWSHVERLSATMRKMVWPCLYTALTTILAFGSLVLSSIKPVIDFGWMMSLGLVVTFLVSFLFFPAAAAVLGSPKTTVQSLPTGLRTMAVLSKISADHGRAVEMTAVILALLGAFGIARLQVENSFINYFGQETEIYQGLKLIDRELGGTTPLEVLVRFDSEPAAEPKISNGSDDELELLLGSVSKGDPVDYWFTPQKIQTVSQVHDFLASRYGVGQVLSLASLIRVGESISQQPFDTFQLSVLYKRMPEALKEALLTPYVSIETNEVRLTARVKDSMPELRRNELLREIRTGLEENLGLKPANVQISGLVVLYNNMLQSLFQSQIMSLGVVMLGIAVMLMFLFRSVKLAIIGIIPNLLAASIILGLMGWARIPLDMMSITIAAIVVGIGVDDCIHYIYRFREEFSVDKNYRAAMQRSHGSIGRAMYYTTLTVLVGFSILVLSNFLPTIYFGVLTALAMAIALLAALTLLPRLILLARPFGD